MKENESAEQVVENREEKCEKAAEQKNIKKINGDTRTFVIALLTSLIVVLLYHGVLTGIRCLKGNCPPPQATAGECRMPQIPSKCQHGRDDDVSDAHRRRHHHRRMRHRDEGQFREHHRRRGERPARPVPESQQESAPSQERSN